jgi:hypothetical protein
LRLLDQENGASGDQVPICLAGRGAAPPEYCGGPTGYRLMLKRQREGQSMCTSAQVEMVIGMLSAADPDQPADTWDLLRQMKFDATRPPCSRCTRRQRLVRNLADDLK